MLYKLRLIPQEQIMVGHFAAIIRISEKLKPYLTYMESKQNGRMYIHYYELVEAAEDYKR